jgi:hypothetical protein
MPRNTHVVAKAKLETAATNYERVTKAHNRAKKTLNETIIKAIEAGLTRQEVATIVGLTSSRVAQLPGVPKGTPGRKSVSS